MTEPFFISRTHAKDHKSSQLLKAWTANTADTAKAQGAKYGRVNTHPVTGEVVFEAWHEDNPANPGAPRWTEQDNA